jgi:GT2 family glycosyltransferase
MTAVRRRIGAVILTHNSSEDLLECLTGLQAQQGVDLMVIVVDNASDPNELMRLEAIFKEALPDGQILAAKGASDHVSPAVFICNETNSGYSQGNNIGARFAAGAGCEAVLIVNPDVQIEDPDYLRNLFDLITADAKTAIACTVLTNLMGSHENPMHEPTFYEELLWPMQMIIYQFFPQKRIEKTFSSKPQLVEKVSGACFLIRMDFLRHIGFFDEKVFLYCEESILSSQVRRLGWHMMMDPCLYAIHAHRTNIKNDPLFCFRIWAKSRSIFHADENRYGLTGQALLSGSRYLILGLIWTRIFFKRVLRVLAEMRNRI